MQQDDGPAWQQYVEARRRAASLAPQEEPASDDGELSLQDMVTAVTGMTGGERLRRLRGTWG